MCSNSYCFHMLKTPYSHLPPPKCSSNNTSFPSPANPSFPRWEKISIPTTLYQQSTLQSQAKRYKIGPLIHLIVWLRKQVFLQVSINRQTQSYCYPRGVVMFSISWEFMKDLGKTRWARLWAIDRLGIKGWVSMSGRGKRIVVWGEKDREMGERKKAVDILYSTLFHLGPLLLINWGGSPSPLPPSFKSTSAHPNPLLYLLFPRTLTFYLEVSSK